MDTARMNLDESRNNSTFLVFGIILVILSLVGAFLLYQIIQNKSNQSETSDLSSERNIPTSALPAPTDIVISPTSTSKSISPSPKISPKASPSPKVSPSPKPTSSAALSPSPTPAIQTFKNKDSSFSVDYSSSRKVYEDQEQGGQRYTFYSAAGNFAIHVNTKWIWTYPARQFTTDFTLSGLPTFRYDISSQTIVDVTKNNVDYTLQCIHNGKDDLKAECEAFLKSFKISN